MRDHVLAGRVLTSSAELDPGKRVEVRGAVDLVTLHRLPVDGDPILLAAHPRAAHRGSLVVDPAHRDPLPDGHTRAVTVGAVAVDAVRHK